MNALHSAPLLRSLLRSFPVAAALSFGGCAATGAGEGDPAPDLSTYRSYDWRVNARTTSADPVDQSVRLEIHRRLGELGLEPAAVPGDADLLLDYGMDISTEVEYRDPYFSIASAFKYEQGTLTIDLFDADTREHLWRGSTARRLRYTARSVGVNSLRFVNLTEERVWPVEDMVETILGRLTRAEKNGEPE